MPNGFDKMLERLRMCCGEYYARYERWPTQARFEPAALHVIAWLLDPESFATLAGKLELRTSSKMRELSVGGIGVVHYADCFDGEHPFAHVDAARRWLGVEARRELDPYADLH